jgi:hypothetical protein
MGEPRLRRLENCPGHVASDTDQRVCGICGTHIDELRPDEPGDLEMLHMDAVRAVERYWDARRKQHGKS